MAIRAAVVGVVLVVAALVSCGSPAPPPPVAVTQPTAASPTPTPAPALAAPPPTSRVLEYTEQRLLSTDAALEPPAYPVRTKSGGSWLTEGADDWTAGFYAGTLWRTYERTRDPAWRQRAETWQAGLARQTKQDSTDLGFKLFDTYGIGYQLTGDESFKRVVLDAADNVAHRYNPKVGMFRVWDTADDRTQFRVNIDALMNLELMFWAGQNGGNPQYADMAEHHALRALQDLVRPDGGTWMVAHYDPRFLDAARRTADNFIRRLPPDRVPYWDFDVPNKATAPRDTSAAAVVASALVELSGYEAAPDAKQRDTDTARDILASLSSPAYAPRKAQFAAMLRHGTQHFPSGWADTGITFGDYYFVEALGRYEKAGNSTAAFMSD